MKDTLISSLIFFYVKAYVMSEKSLCRELFGQWNHIQVSLYQDWSWIHFQANGFMQGQAKLDSAKDKSDHLKQLTLMQTQSGQADATIHDPE